MNHRFAQGLARIASAATLALALVAALAPAAHAQERYPGRAHMELSFAPGWGFSIGEQYTSASACSSLYCGFGSSFPPSDEMLALASDLRIYAPENVGFALRLGVGWGVVVLEPGAAYEVDLHTGTEGAVRLQLAGGAAITAAFASVGPGQTRDALGGWAQAGIDVRHGSFFAGVALDLRAMVRPGDGVAYGVITPILRIGGEWGL